MTVNLLLRLLKMHVPRGADGLSEFFPQTDDDSVELPQILFGAGVAVAEQERVIAKRLDFEVVVEGRDTF